MKVLLIADVGGFPKGYLHYAHPNYYFHVGDEAMFLQTVEWYKKYNKNFKITAFTWKNKYKKVKINTINHFVWPTKKIINRLFFFIFLIKYFCQKYLKIHTLTQEEEKLVLTISSHDIIHFTGGGNISSIYPAWLYYVLFIICIAYFAKKKIILTSQSFGPFKNFDKILFLLIFRLPDIVGIREAKNCFKKNNINIYSKNIKYMLDAAYDLPTQKSTLIPKKSKKIRIGISAHTWSSLNTEIVTTIFTKIINKINLEYDCEFVFIPHIITEDKENWDLALFENIIKNINPSIKIINIPRKFYIMSGEKVIYFIKSLVESCDLYITTRYHGLIFALSANVPAIGLSYDYYYHMKNYSAYNHIYGELAGKYEVYLNNIDNLDNIIIQKVNKILLNLVNEKKLLIRLNKKIKNDPNLFTLNDLKNLI